MIRIQDDEGATIVHVSASPAGPRVEICREVTTRARGLSVGYSHVNIDPNHARRLAQVLQWVADDAEKQAKVGDE